MVGWMCQPPIRDTIDPTIILMYASTGKIKHARTRTYLHVVGQLRDVDLEARGGGEGPKLGEVRVAEVDAVDDHHLVLVVCC